MLCQTAYINGNFVPADEATVSVLDHGFLYGDGVFEGIQIVNSGIFKLKEHVKRLFRSAKFIEIEIPMTQSAMGEAIVQLCELNSLRDGYVRPIVTRGAGPMGIRNMDQLNQPTVAIMAQKEASPGRRDISTTGRIAQISAIRRVPPECLDPSVKSCNYLNNVLAYLGAKHAGANSAIMLDTNGYVSEGYASNLFAVRNGEIWTPESGSILRGITRDTIHDICRQVGIGFREQRLTVYDLVTAEEVFEAASMSEIMPVTKIDGKPVADGKVGPVSLRIYDELRELMENGASSTPISARTSRA